MTDLQQHGTTETEIEALSRSRQSLAYVRQELMEYRPDLTDADLRSRVTKFLMAPGDLPPASAKEHISQELHDIKEDNAMYREIGMTNPENAFPDRCKGCSHYGERCPVLTETRAIKHRKRIFEQTNDPTELRRRLREYAIDHNCHVIKDAIDDLVEEHEPLLVEGQLLLMLVEEELHFGDTNEDLIRTLTNRVEQVQTERLQETSGDADASADASDDGAAAESPQEPAADSDGTVTTAADEPLEADGGVQEEAPDDEH